MNAFAACDDMRGPLVCPKPRRVFQLSAAADSLDLKARVELFDIFLTKGGENQVDPFFCGSPPTRSANPLIHDARFIEATYPVPNPDPVLLTPSIPVPIPVHVPVPARTGCARTNFGFTPAMVRVEGFDCLNRDRRGIPAFA